MASLEEAYHYLFSILKELASGDLGVLDLAFRLNARPETVKRHLETMEKYGLVRVEKRPGRKTRIELTELGACLARCLADSSYRTR